MKVDIDPGGFTGGGRADGCRGIAIGLLVVLGVALAVGTVIWLVR